MVRYLYVLFFTGIIVNGLIPGLVIAQSGSSITIPYIDSDIQFDGMPDEPEWQIAQPFPLTTYFPEDGLQPTERSDIRMIYDDHYLYVGARLYDSNPEGIQSTTFQRNFEGLSSDMFGIILDTFNSNESGVAFFTNPVGARSDFQISNDAEGNAPFNFDWDTFWDVETVQNEEGWFLEMRIPLSSLRYQEQDGRVMMGLTVMRWIARKNESNLFPAIPNNWGFNGQFKPSQTHTIYFERLEYSRPLQITPYVLGGYSRENQLSEPVNGLGSYERNEQFTYEAGLDVKYGISSNLTLDLTVNTDFAQVEADDEQVNLTRFALFLPEKRRFFQERSDLFDINMGGSNRLFYSRRVGIRNGQQIRILGGARMTGTIGSWDFGLLNMQTARSGDIPSENFGVMRLRRNVFNPSSYIGTMITSRLSEGGAYHYTYGLDGTFHLFGDDYLTFQYGQVVDSEMDHSFYDIHSTRMRIEWSTRRIIGWGYTLGFSRNGARFTPATGFAGRLNYSRFGPQVNYGWQGSANSRFQNHQVSLGGNVFIVDNSGELESINAGPEWTSNWKSGSRMSVSVNYNYEHLRETFWIRSDVPIHVGEYNFVNLGVNYNTPEGGLFSSETELMVGQFFDGYRLSAGVSTRMSLSRYFNVQPFYEFNRIIFPDRDQSFNTHIARLRVEFFLNTRFSVRSFVQYSNASDLVVSNFRLRFNPREGNDFYIMFNENLNTDRHAFTPVQPVSQFRSILIKYNYTF